MTLVELMQLLKRYWLVSIVIPIVCTIACYVVLMMIPASYQATATVTLTAQGALVDPQAKSFADDSDAEGVKLAVALDTAKTTITITGSGADPDACVEAVNDVAEKTDKFVEDDLKDAAGNPIAISHVVKSDDAADTSPSKVKYCAVVFLAERLFL